MNRMNYNWDAIDICPRAFVRVASDAWRLVLQGMLAVAVSGLLFFGNNGIALAESTNDPEDSAREYQIKAAFLYNFAKFTEWPEIAFDDSSAPLRVCVLGDSPFGDQLDLIGGKTVHDRQIATSSLSRVEETGPCHLLFIGTSEPAVLARILEDLSRRPVLTVSDMKGFANAGGMIGLKTIDNKIRFIVNLEAIRNAAVVLSPQVLRLADIVSGVKTAHDNSGTRAVQ